MNDLKNNIYKYIKSIPIRLMLLFILITVFTFIVLIGEVTPTDDCSDDSEEENYNE